MVDRVTVATKFFTVFVKNFGVLSFTRQTPPVKVRIIWNIFAKLLYDNDNKELHCGIYLLFESKIIERVRNNCFFDLKNSQNE